MKIELSNLEKHFGTNTAVDIKSFTINNGDILGLVGNNGAGKTTLFRLMLDLLKADEGVVTMHPSAYGVELGPSSLKLSPDGGVGGGSPINPALSEDWKAYTGAYIDDGFLIDFLTAEEYFDFIGRVSGMTKEQIAPLRCRNQFPIPQPSHPHTGLQKANGATPEARSERHRVQSLPGYPG